MKSIPEGWIMNPDGSYSKPSGRKSPFLTVFQPHKNDPEPMKEKKPRRIRQDSKPLMNKLESEYYKILISDSDCSNVRAQSIRFKLANGLWYKVDLTCVIKAHFSCFEVKGPFSFRGGIENLKSAAFLYPEINWFLVWKSDSGQWLRQKVLS